jgi:hypothetical protein
MATKTELAKSNKELITYLRHIIREGCLDDMMSESFVDDVEIAIAKAEAL